MLLIFSFEELCAGFHNWVGNVAWQQDWPKVDKVNQNCSIYQKLRETMVLRTMYC